MRAEKRYTRNRNTLAYAVSGDAGDLTASAAATVTVDGYAPQPVSQREADMIGASVGQYAWKIFFPNDGDIVRDDVLTEGGKSYKVNTVIAMRRWNLKKALVLELDR